MKIIIPVVDDRDHKLTIADGFNTSNHFCLYDIEKNTLHWMEANQAINGNVTAELNRLQISGVITNGMKFMALGLFRENGLVVYKSNGKELERNIDLFIKKELLPFSLTDALDESSCGSGCSTCSSTTCAN